jgi:hypothetical protein
VADKSAVSKSVFCSGSRDAMAYAPAHVHALSERPL